MLPDVWCRLFEIFIILIGISNSNFKPGSGYSIPQRALFFRIMSACTKNEWLNSVSVCITSSLAGPQHSGRDGDGRHGPGDQHERNHHAGGRAEQDGEVRGKRDPARPLYVWPDCTLPLKVLYTVCRHVCMLHPACYSSVPLWMLLTNSWVFVLFFGLSSCYCTALNKDQDSTYALLYSLMWIKYQSHHFCP